MDKVYNKDFNTEDINLKFLHVMIHNADFNHVSNFIVLFESLISTLPLLGSLTRKKTQIILLYNV